jgi:hypothetical protein
MKVSYGKEWIFRGVINFVVYLSMNLFIVYLVGGYPVSSDYLFACIFGTFLGWFAFYLVLGGDLFD